MRYMIFDRWGNPLGDLPYAIKAIRTRATDGTDTLDVTTIGEINKDERIVFKDSMGRWAEYLCQSTQTARAAGMPVTVAYCTGSIAELAHLYRGQTQPQRERQSLPRQSPRRHPVGGRHRRDRHHHRHGQPRLLPLHRPRSHPEDRRHLRARSPDRSPARPDRQPDRPAHHPPRRTPGHRQHHETLRIRQGPHPNQTRHRQRRRHHPPLRVGQRHRTNQRPRRGHRRIQPQNQLRRRQQRQTLRPRRPSARQLGHTRPRRHQTPQRGKRGLPPTAKTPQELLNLTKAALKTRATPVVSYTADVTALGQAGLSAEGTDVGDSVRIIDTSLRRTIAPRRPHPPIEEDLAGSLADTKDHPRQHPAILHAAPRRPTAGARQTRLQLRRMEQRRRRHRPVHEGPHRPHQPDHERDRRIRLPDAQPRHLRVRQADRPAPHAGHQIGGGYWRCASSRNANGDWNWRSLANGKGHLRRRDLHRPALRRSRLQQLEPRHRRLQTLRTNDGRRKNGRRDRRRLIVGSARRSEEVRRPDEA